MCIFLPAFIPINIRKIQNNVHRGEQSFNSYLYFCREYQLALPRKEVEEVNNLRDRWKNLMDLADRVSVFLLQRNIK